MKQANEPVHYVWHERPVMAEMEVCQVQAILLTRDGRVLIRIKNGEARLSGGHPEPGERSLVATLKREVMEEAWCEIDRYEYLGYQEAWTRKTAESGSKCAVAESETKRAVAESEAKRAMAEPGANCAVAEPKSHRVATTPEIQARMVARVAKILPAQPDPARTERWVYGRRLVSRAEATRAYERSFGEIGRRLVELAYAMAEAEGWFTEPLSEQTEELNEEEKD